VYRPKQFSKKHKGKTKQEIIKEEGGWQIMFVEDMPHIPREGKGKTTKGRKQFETNDTPNNYLKVLNNAETKKTDPHNGEQGMTPEEQIIYAITHLEKRANLLMNLLMFGRAAAVASLIRSEHIFPFGTMCRTPTGNASIARPT